MSVSFIRQMPSEIHALMQDADNQNAICVPGIEYRVAEEHVAEIAGPEMRHRPAQRRFNRKLFEALFK